ncbi:MAG TPA: acyloxyacyl hydrolase, partial [Burkholderiaceae bacterium]|nr:acyloxyacyl hydrolase [Burkholderiaceae bacterium]
MAAPVAAAFAMLIGEVVLGSLSRCTSCKPLALIGVALCLFVPSTSDAEGLRPLNIGVRARFSQTEVLGKETVEEFHEVDVSASFALPWTWKAPSGWEPSTRLMAGAGVLNGAGKPALVVSFIPVLAIQHQRLTLDLGLGGALLSRHQFGSQDFGGAFQFAFTAGAGVLLSERFGVGYRLLHYSDAGMYGSNRTGVDLHMLEIT